MPRINPVTEHDTPAKSRPLLEGVQKSLGMTPNLMATLAHAPAALQAYLGFGQALGTGALGGALREQIALAVAGENACGYCASAHTALGRMLKVADDELQRNLKGDSADPRVQAALEFARTIVAARGRVSDDALAAVRDAGYDDGEIVEIIANVAINIFTNYFNHIADTAIDFPVVAVPEPIGA